jgi:hypothetical protein
VEPIHRCFAFLEIRSANGQHSYYEEIGGLRNKKTPWCDVNGSQLLGSDRIQKQNQGDYNMHSTQNERINQITFSTLIIGVDIAKFKHLARAQDFRGVQFGKPITFENNREGFELFESWFQKISIEQDFQDVLVGMEPTGHY